MRNKIYDEKNNNIRTIIKESFEKRLLEFVMKNFPASLFWVDKSKLLMVDEETSLRMLMFFLQQPNIKDETLYYWEFGGCYEFIDLLRNADEGFKYIFGNHQKKSVLRAFFNSYNQAIKDKYGVRFDYVIFRVFSDENYLVPLLGLDSLEKEKLFEQYDAKSIIDLFNFLKQHYSQKELYKIIVSALHSIKESEAFSDTLRMTYQEELLPIYMQYFNRVRSNIIAIHDELAKISGVYVQAFLENRRLESLKCLLITLKRV